MKVFLLEPDKVLADNIDTYLNQCRLKVDVKKINNEKDFFNEDIASLSSYRLFILNLKNPANTCIMKHIRKHGSDVPILLILEPDIHASIFKTLYYLSYDNVIVKNFSVEEIAFHIYKLCHIWNDNIFFLTKDIYFEFDHATFVNKDEEIFLGRKEALLLKLLFIKSPYVASCNEIACYVYQDEIASEERIRSLIRQLRAKIPLDFIETQKGEGYKIVNKKVEESIALASTIPLVNSTLLFLSTYYPVCQLVEQL